MYPQYVCAVEDCGVKVPPAKAALDTSPALAHRVPSPVVYQQALLAESLGQGFQPESRS